MTERNFARPLQGRRVIVQGLLKLGLTPLALQSSLFVEGASANGSESSEMMARPSSSLPVDHAKGHDSVIAQRLYAMTAAAGSPDILAFVGNLFKVEFEPIRVVADVGTSYTGVSADQLFAVELFLAVNGRWVVKVGLRAQQDRDTPCVRVDAFEAELLRTAWRLVARIEHPTLAIIYDRGSSQVRLSHIGEGCVSGVEYLENKL